MGWLGCTTKLYSDIKRYRSFYKLLQWILVTIDYRLHGCCHLVSHLCHHLPCQWWCRWRDHLCSTWRYHLYKHNNKVVGDSGELTISTIRDEETGQNLVRMASRRRMRLGKAGMAEAQPRDTVDGGRYRGRNGGGCEGEGTPDEGHAAFWGGLSALKICIVMSSLLQVSSCRPKHKSYFPPLTWVSLKTMYKYICLKFLIHSDETRLHK